MEEFVKFPKIPRLDTNGLHCIITEKIDGTNAQIYISGDELVAGSRNRALGWCNKQYQQAYGPDNYGFFNWCLEHREDLIDVLGEGRWYGEWFGGKIQRGYGLREKQFAIFNTSRPVDTLPECVKQVPVLYAGAFDTHVCNDMMLMLRDKGSQMVPDFMNPEGIIAYLPKQRIYFKDTFDGPKWKQEGM